MKCDEALRILENADRICNERVIDAENAVEEAFSAVDKLKTAIVIPEGATNGDVIKVLFPDAKITHRFELGTLMGNILYIRFCKRQEMRVQQDWLNAPYRKEGGEKCL